MKKIIHTQSTENKKDFQDNVLKQDENNLLSAYQRIQDLNDLKSKFITTVSHEFRTPLAIMQSSIVLAKHYGKKGQLDKVDKHLKDIEINMKALNELIDQVAELNFSNEEISSEQLIEFTENHTVKYLIEFKQLP